MAFLRGLWPVLRKFQFNIWRGTVIVTAIGILPGAGADIVASISYSVGKKFSKNPEVFGKGSEKGLVDAGAANNAAIAGAWVPALMFGIPGDSVTAVVICMGIVAWFMEANEIPIAPAILGIVLGDMLEKKFLTSMMQSDGRLMAFVERPIAATLAAITFAIWLSLAWKAWKGRASSVPSPLAGEG